MIELCYATLIDVCGCSVSRRVVVLANVCACLHALVCDVCVSGDTRLGHPVEYIQLNKVRDEPAVCKYCGLRFRQAHHGDGHGGGHH